MIEISLVELQLHVGGALGAEGVELDEFTIEPDRAGGWRIEVCPRSAAQERRHKAAARRIEAALGRLYRLHRQSLGSPCGG